MRGMQKSKPTTNNQTHAAVRSPYLGNTTTTNRLPLAAALDCSVLLL